MGWSAGGVVSAVVTAHIAIVGDENETLAEPPRANAVRAMLGDDVDSEWVPIDGVRGLQYAVVEYFRNVLGVSSASHAESDGADESNVVSALARRLMGEERLVSPIPLTRFSALVGDEPFVGMHYCGYGPAPA